MFGVLGFDLLSKDQHLKHNFDEYDRTQIYDLFMLIPSLKHAKKNRKACNLAFSACLMPKIKTPFDSPGCLP